MASREIVDRYLEDLGGYFKLRINSYIEGCGGRAKFINPFIACPYQKYQNESVFRIDDADQIENAMADFYFSVGKELRMEVASIGLDDDFEIFFSFFYQPTFYDEQNPIQMFLGKTLEIDDSDYEVYFGMFEDEVIKAEIDQLVEKIWKFNFKPTQ